MRQWHRMRCPACGEGNSDKAAICELCQTPLRAPHPGAAREARQAVMPAVVTPRVTPPPAVPAPALARPAILHLPEPTVPTGHGLRNVLFMLLLVGGGAWSAYRYWPPADELTAAVPSAVPPPSPVAAATPAPKAPPGELPTVAVPSSQPAAAAPSAAVQPIIEIKPTE